MPINSGRYAIRLMDNDGQLMSTAINYPLAVGTTRFGAEMPFLQWEVDFDCSDNTVMLKQTDGNAPGETFASCADDPANYSYVVLGSKPKKFRVEENNDQYSFYVLDDDERKLYIGPTQGTASPRKLALRYPQHKFRWNLKLISENQPRH